MNKITIAILIIIVVGGIIGNLMQNKYKEIKDTKTISLEKPKTKQIKEESISDKLLKELKNKNMFKEDISVAESIIFSRDKEATFVKKEIHDNIKKDWITQYKYFKLSDGKTIVIVNKISNNQFLYQLTKICK